MKLVLIIYWQILIFVIDKANATRACFIVTSFIKSGFILINFKTKVWLKLQLYLMFIFLINTMKWRLKIQFRKYMMCWKALKILLLCQIYILLKI